jgi:hypothetical protein
MKYLLLIYEDENLARHRHEADAKTMNDAYIAYTKALRDAGVLLAGDALQPISTATTVRVRQGKTTVTDGPFAETKEQLGGYYLIDVPDLDEALKWAERIPSAKTGSIEVRPMYDYEV